MNLTDMLAEYANSYFQSRDFVPADRVITPGQKKAAERDYDADPVRCLMGNVEQSAEDVRETAARMRLAKQDGLLDRDLYRSATTEEKKRWRDAIAMLKGDHARALAELAHWRNYVQWAMDEQRAKAGHPAVPPEAEETL